jgi:uncharacterized FlaG/YvyC family protein
MEIGPLNRISAGTPAVGEGTQENLAQLVSAIRTLNGMEFLGRGRELKLRRGAGRRPMVELLDLETGEVLDELPPEQVLRMMTELEKEREEDL